MLSGAAPIWLQPPARGPYPRAPPTLPSFLGPPPNLPPRPPFRVTPPHNRPRFPQSQNFALSPFTSALQPHSDHQYYSGPPPLKQTCISGVPGGWNFSQQCPPPFPAGPPSWSNHRPQRKAFQKVTTLSSGQTQLHSNHPLLVPHVQRQRQTKGPPSLVQHSPGPKPVMFVCSPCHKEYKSRETYETHMATHVKVSCWTAGVGVLLSLLTSFLPPSSAVFSL